MILAIIETLGGAAPGCTAAKIPKKFQVPKLRVPGTLCLKGSVSTVLAVAASSVALS